VPEIHGHRGARALRPENTLPGLAHALAIGVDALEFDVTLTADGGLILAHDLTVDPVTILDTGPASDGDPLFPYVGRRWADLTLAQIDTLDAGGRRPPDPFEATFVPVQGTGVPTLDQVCRLITEAAAAQVTLCVELKTEPSWPVADVRTLTGRALAVLAKYGLAGHGLAGRSRILAFDWRVLVAAREADPAVPRVALIEPATWVPGSAWLAGFDPAAYGAETASGQGVADVPGCAAAARDIGAAWLSVRDAMVGAKLVPATREAGLGLIAWTVNDTGRMAELIDLGVDAIVTDRPDLLRAVKASKGLPLPAPCRLPWPADLPAWAPGIHSRAFTTEPRSPQPGPGLPGR
jgi:glycerophosphoryl diester phosphodiesterase